jgi:NAD(P)-dependent dehydrogenase (short-subunit alcohol dehydrogenase family)
MQVAIVTGASRGFGRAVARGLADDGWALVLDARGHAALESTAAALARDAAVRAIAGDITDAAHRAALVDAARELGELRLVVNNAGALGPSPQPRLADYPLDVLRAVYDVNVVAQLGLIQVALPSLRRASTAAIVDITSDAAREPYEGWGGYGSSKAALEQLGNVLATEEPNVRVYTFDPGDMRTQMHQDAFPGKDISDRPEPETVVPAFLRLMLERPPSGRYRAADFTAVTT